MQVILSGEQAAQLAEAGTALEAKEPSAQRRSLQAADGVFRPYSGEGGILEELMAQAAAHPDDRRVPGDRADRNRARTSARCA